MTVKQSTDEIERIKELVAGPHLRDIDERLKRLEQRVDALESRLERCHERTPPPSVLRRLRRRLVSLSDRIAGTADE